MEHSLIRSRAVLTLIALLSPVATLGREFDVRDYGAIGDGVALDSPAINAAIVAAAEAGGGTVVLPAGDYLSYSIRLRSDITMRLEAGTTLTAADPPPAGEKGGYDAPEPNEQNLYQDFGHTHWRNSLIWGEGLENVAIVGPGLIYGRGLSKGQGRVTPFPLTWDTRKPVGENVVPPDTTVTPGPFGYPSPGDQLPAGVGNKAIALKNCRNVTLRDFRILHGGHFGILATAVDNLTIDNLLIDTERDGIDIDACNNVRITNCSVNSPFDDAICLKASRGLGYDRATENVTIANCYVSGFDEGTLMDGTRRQTHPFPTGRIKFGTEANGGFRNITITNCVFEWSRGLALEQVDGGVLEDVTISNLTMRNMIQAPIFIRLGERLRAPEGTPVGHLRRVRISNVVASNVGRTGGGFSPQGILILGTPARDIEDLTLEGIDIEFLGGGARADAEREMPELEKEYPEPGKWQTVPAWGVFARRVKNLQLRDITLRTRSPDGRHAVILEMLDGVRLDNVSVSEPRAGGAAPLRLHEVEGLVVRDSPGLVVTAP